MRVYTHPACFGHEPGAGHPESPARLHAVLQALDDPRFSGLERIEAPRASHGQLGSTHRPDYVDRIFASAPDTGATRLDPDTVMSPGSLEAALHAAGAACAATDAVLAGATTRAFCAVRPPGHHATREAAMGFCLFNNVALAATHALSAYRLDRVAIVDFDVHHGNGTQDIFRHDPRVLYASSHQMPLYPGTGAVSEHGCGNVFNAPLPPGTQSAEFRATWEKQLLPELDLFRPQLLLVSAGFDADARDPLAQLQLVPADYAWITQRLVELADRHADGRIVSSLEGGYDLDALREGVAAHVAALLGLHVGRE
ncbi:MAG TPA: histone deacetylase family protein [Rhodanobacteraceae bacterium]|nr:histone deacetylase family protein [Rhodanobacteraceae bacterium]